MQSLPLNTPYLFSMSLNDDIVDIEKPNGTCSPTFVVNDFSDFFSHLFISSVKDSRSA